MAPVLHKIEPLGFSETQNQARCPQKPIVQTVLGCQMREAFTGPSSTHLTSKHSPPGVDIKCIYNCCR